jgi:hypothetical protein
VIGSFPNSRCAVGIVSANPIVILRAPVQPGHYSPGHVTNVEVVISVDKTVKRAARGDVQQVSLRARYAGHVAMKLLRVAGAAKPFISDGNSFVLEAPTSSAIPVVMPERSNSNEMRPAQPPA